MILWFSYLHWIFILQNLFQPTPTSFSTHIFKLYAPTSDLPIVHIQIFSKLHCSPLQPPVFLSFVHHEQEGFMQNSAMEYHQTFT